MAAQRKAPQQSRGTLELKHALDACARAFRSVWTFSAGINVLMLVLPLYMMQIFDRVVTTRHVDTLVLLTIIAIGSIVVMGMLEAARGFVAARVSVWVDKTLSPELLTAAVNSVALQGKNESAQALRDLTTVRTFVGGQGIFPLFDAPWAPIFLGVVYLMHPLLGIVSAVGLVILFLLAVGNEALTRRSIRKSGEEIARAHNEADHTIRNADVITAMGMLPALLRHWRGINDPAVRLQLRASEWSVVLQSATKVVRLGLQLVIMGMGAWLAIQGQITSGTMIAASIIMGRAVAPVEQAIGTWKTMLASWFAYVRVREAMARATGPLSTTTLPAPEGKLSVDGATVYVPGVREPILRGIRFALEPGEALGIIGPSAAGKTTLARLLVGSIAPTAGAVRLDGADINVWDSADRGQHVGYLPQDVELFNGAIKANIGRFGEASDEAVVAAARQAGVHEMILEMPQGYDTPLQAGGAPLSGGQRQRVGLARALFGEPRFVVLDEPNSHLDMSGEQALVEAIRELKARGATVVVVAQRFSGLKEMDKLLVMKAGAVEAFGPRDEILAQIGRRLQVAELRPARAKEQA